MRIDKVLPFPEFAVGPEGARVNSPRLQPGVAGNTNPKQAPEGRRGFEMTQRRRPFGASVGCGRAPQAEAWGYLPMPLRGKIHTRSGAFDGNPWPLHRGLPHTTGSAGGC